MVPVAFKLDHMHPIEPFLLQKIFNFFTFILGGQFLLPQRANNGKGERERERESIFLTLGAVQMIIVV